MGLRAAASYTEPEVMSDVQMECSSVVLCPSFSSQDLCLLVVIDELDY